MVDVLEDISILENLLIAMNKGAYDEKRMAINSLESLLNKKKQIITEFEKEFAPNDQEQNYKE